MTGKMTDHNLTTVLYGKGDIRLVGIVMRPSSEFQSNVDTLVACPTYSVCKPYQTLMSLLDIDVLVFGVDEGLCLTGVVNVDALSAVQNLPTRPSLL